MLALGDKWQAPFLVCFRVIGFRVDRIPLRCEKVYEYGV